MKTPSKVRKPAKRPPKRKGPAQYKLGGGEDPVIKGGARRNREPLASGDAEKRDTLRWPADLRRRYAKLATKRGVSFNAALVAGLAAGLTRAFRKPSRKVTSKASPGTSDATLPSSANAG